MPVHAQPLLWKEEAEWEKEREKRQAEYASLAAARGKQAERKLAEEKWIQQRIAKVPLEIYFPALLLVY
jgi:hypothetical protein